MVCRDWRSKDQCALRRSKRKVVTDLQRVGLKVLQRYGTTVAVGAGVLTVGALCTLLQHIGAGDVVENAMFWKRIGH